MVVIKNLKDIPCSLYYGDELIGIIDNILDFADVRVQIKEEYKGKNYEITPYYFLFEGKKLVIDSNGDNIVSPDGFFDTWTNLLIELV